MNSANPQSAHRNWKFLALRSPAAILIFVLTMGFGLTLDLWSKSYAFRSLTYGDPERDRFTGHLRVDSDSYNLLPGWLRRLFKKT